MIMMRRLYKWPTVAICGLLLANVIAAARLYRRAPETTRRPADLAASLVGIRDIEGHAIGGVGPTLIGVIDPDDEWALSHFSTTAHTYAHAVRSVLITPTATSVGLSAPLAQVNLPMTAAFRRLGLKGFAMSRWALYDSVGRLRATGRLDGSDLVAQLKSLSLPLQPLGTSLETEFAALERERPLWRRLGVSANGHHLFLFVNELSPDCPVTSTVLALNRLHSRSKGETEPALVVPRTWTDDNIVALTSNLGLRLPVLRADASIEDLWMRLRVTYGQRLDLGFILHQRDGISPSVQTDLSSALRTIDQ